MPASRRAAAVDPALAGRVRGGEFGCLAAQIVPAEQFGKAREDQSGGLDMIRMMMGGGMGDESEDSDGPQIPTWEEVKDSDEEQGDKDYKLSVMGQMVQMSGPMSSFAEEVVERISVRRTSAKVSLVLDIRLVGILPEIRRRVRVPSNTPMAALHDKVIAPAVGWMRNYHAYLFTLGSWAYPNGRKLPEEHDISFGPVDSGAVDMMHSKGFRGGKHIVDATKVCVSDLLQEPGQYMKYIYDLGDTFVHKVTLVEVQQEFHTAPLVLEGFGKCPPEDSGGNYQHAERLHELRTTGRVKDGKLPHGWVPEQFDMEATARAVDKAWNSDISRGDAANMFTMNLPTGCSGRTADVDPSYEPQRSCGSCGAQLAKSFLCSRCRNVAYCGAECQRSDWQFHKRICIRK
eukprot:TRINITY_DN33148_c0_g1_i1.p1 TRINITY_DN33148_c0_g1~~TRINITY_DN33148_c0_g1_i1.p1  ORF type:complete len:425 (+),score=60.22 TRINITY_DN33148_c0_g1_i1:71-1276(+)